MSTSKGKGPVSKYDWRRPNPKEDTSPEALAKLRLPFRVYPELKDVVPADFRGDAYHLTTPQEGVPFTRYYTPYPGTGRPLLVSSGDTHRLRSEEHTS